jgi:hypothetical protein
VRKLTDHIVNPVNDRIDITVMDEPGSGGAHHHYAINVDGSVSKSIDITFQNGPINESGVNGITQEVLLAIVADRLRCFQKGPFATKANACALTHVEEAMMWLHQRTLERMKRGVEGTLAA